MKKIKSSLSIVLVVVLLISLNLGVYAQSPAVYVVATNKTGTIKTATVASGEYTYTAQYNTITEESTIITKKGNIVKEVLHIDPDSPQFTQDAPLRAKAAGLSGGEDEGKYLVSYQHTFLDYEYEEWKYPNYAGGQGYFWFFKKPTSDTELSVYESSRGNSKYSSSIDGYVAAVETINDTEVIVGGSVAAAIAVAFISGGGAAVVLPKITALLEAVGIVGAVTMANNLWSATQDCERYWNEILAA